MTGGASILTWVWRLALAAVAACGLVLLFLPGVARGLVRSAERAPWTFSRASADPSVPAMALAESGLSVSPWQVDRNHDRWSRMSAAQRTELLDRLEKVQELPQAERDLLVSRYEELQKLPDRDRTELRRQAAALARFEASLGRQDLATLDGLSGKARAKFLADLWRARQGLP